MPKAPTAAARTTKTPTITATGNTVTGVTAPLRTAPKQRVAEKSATITRVPLSDVEDFTNGLWYGPGGTGKTTALAAAANLGTLILVNAEGGIKKRPLAKRGINVSNIESVVLADYENKYDTLEGLFWQIKDELTTKPGSIVAVGWDSVTEIAKVVLRDVISARVAKAERTGKGSDDPFFTDRSDFGVQTEQLRLLLRRFRDLPCHFGVSALERRDQDDDGAVHYGPAVGPAFATDLFGYMDVVCHTSVSDTYTDEEYWGHFRPVGKYDAKDRLDVIPHAGLVDPWFDRVVGYVNDTLTLEHDPIMGAARERRRAASESAAAKADDE